MVHAIDVLEKSLKKTQKLLFPIRLKFWARLGIVTLFGGNKGGVSFSNPITILQESAPSELDFKEYLVQVNTQGLQYVHNYGWIISVFYAFIALITFIFSYLTSVFSFVYMDAIDDKNFSIRSSFKKQKPLGTSLFWVKMVFALLGWIVTIALFYPISQAFFAGTLSTFDFSSMIWQSVMYFLLGTCAMAFWIIVYDFVIPVMYAQNLPFRPAFKKTLGFLGMWKFDVFAYFLMKFALFIAALVLAIIVSLPLMLVLLLIAGIIVGVFFLGIKYLSVNGAVYITSALSFVFSLFSLYLIFVYYLPFSVFFRIYSIEFMRKIVPEGNKKKQKKTESVKKTNKKKIGKTQTKKKKN